MNIFDRYGYWKVLGFFLKRPGTEVFVKELSRTLNISPSSSNSALKYFHKLGILDKSERGPAHFYALNNDFPLVQSLKRTFILFVLEEIHFSESCAESEPNLISLSIYGSFANGTFDEKSDLDLLMIGGDKTKLRRIADLLERKLDHEINIECFSIADWQKMKNKNDVFYREIVRNHILLTGVSPI